MTASGTTVYPGAYKAYCFKKSGAEISVYIPQLFGPVPVFIKDATGSLPNANTYGYVVFEGGDSAYPVWVSSQTFTGPQGPQGPQGPTPVRYYGAFQYLGTQTIASTTTAYSMPFDTTDFSSGVSKWSASPTDGRIKIANAGVYNIQWSGQFQNTANAIHDMKIWLRKNGNNVPGSTGFVSIPARKSASAGQEAHEIVGWNYFLDFNANDYFEIMWTADSTSVSLVSYAAGTNPTTPTTAAVIVTVSMV